jgi:hypothetical protein
MAIDLRFFLLHTLNSCCATSSFHRSCILDDLWVGVGWFVVFPPLERVHPYHNLSTSRPSSVLSGGLQKGSGGKLEHNWDSYDPKNLFTPSQAQNSSNALLPAFAFPSPESCGSCHTAIQSVWQQSMHAISATDDWYVRVKETFALERGDAAW